MYCSEQWRCRLVRIAEKPRGCLVEDITIELQLQQSRRRLLHRTTRTSWPLEQLPVRSRARRTPPPSSIRRTNKASHPSSPKPTANPSPSNCTTSTAATKTRTSWRKPRCNNSKTGATNPAASSATPPGSPRSPPKPPSANSSKSAFSAPTCASPSPSVSYIREVWGVFKRARF